MVTNISFWGELFLKLRWRQWNSSNKVSLWQNEYASLNHIRKSSPISRISAYTHNHKLGDYEAAFFPQNLMNDIRWYLSQQILGTLRVQGLSSRCALIKATTPVHNIQMQHFTVNAQWDCSARDIAIELRQWKKATALFRVDPLADMAYEKNSRMTGRQACGGWRSK